MNIVQTIPPLWLIGGTDSTRWSVATTAASDESVNSMHDSFMLARKKLVPPSAGMLPTHTPLFVGLLVGTVLLVGAMTRSSPQWQSAPSSSTCS